MNSNQCFSALTRHMFAFSCSFDPSLSQGRGVCGVLLVPRRCQKRWKREFREGWRRRFVGWREKKDPDKIRHVSLGPLEETEGRKAGRKLRFLTLDSPQCPVWALSLKLWLW